MRKQDFKAPLLFLGVGFLVGKELLLDGIVIKGIIGNSGVFENNRDPIVPAAIFGAMVTRRVHRHLQHATHFHLFLEQWIVILLEEPQEFVGVAPFGLVVILDNEGFIRGGLGCGNGGE